MKRGAVYCNEVQCNVVWCRVECENSGEIFIHVSTRCMHESTKKLERLLVSFVRNAPDGASDGALDDASDGARETRLCKLIMT